MIYPSIRIEGSILSGEILDAIEREEKRLQGPKDFGLGHGSRVKDEIADAWAASRAYWTAYENKVARLKPGETGTTETRNLFIVPFLELLGYSPEFARSGEEVQGKNYPISHRDHSRDGFPIHVIGPRHGNPEVNPEHSTLDVRSEGQRRMSPHALVQEYLNLTEHVYALVSNGLCLRLLRDSSRLVKLSFLEFDLERIFTEELFADFAILFRVLHATRMPRDQVSASESIIEIYHQDALEAGSAIRMGLGRAVEDSILALANGFLAHPANKALREAMNEGAWRDGRTDIRYNPLEKHFYISLLRLIYRLLFLMVIEERDLVFPRGSDARQRRFYYDFYSIGRLRRLAEKRQFADKNFADAWAALTTTFRLFEDGQVGGKLEIGPLGGLFSEDAIGLLSKCRLNNQVLLTCIRNLSWFQHPETKQWMRVNYAALNVEEFGSVYEGLLEYDPEVSEPSPGEWQFSFKSGEERASSGSHYTPDELVQPLIKHSLDYLIADRLKQPDTEKALLSLTVCDVACGSGHILLSAARRIGTQLAIVRTGEEQPSPSALRKGIRDVVRSCIYGVDLNPLAVELCKVALWLEAHVPGEPLNFLDHRIKCGNAIVGLARQEELQRGIPDEAFKTLFGDDKDTAAFLRKQNKAERQGYQELPWTQTRKDDLAALQSELLEITALPESTPEEIEKKQKRYDDYERSHQLRNLKSLADLQVAQFYLPKTEKERNKVTTHDQYWKYLRGENFHPEPTDAAQGIATRKRFFHWFLEFPNTLSTGGFDCILGNPPFLNGTRISTRYGKRLLNCIYYYYPGLKSRADYVAYFFRRAFHLLSPEGFQALISTNTLSQGDTREGGLEEIIRAGGEIVFAIPSMKWPGLAAVDVALTSITRRSWMSRRYLGTKLVDKISSHLDEGGLDLTPYTLNANEGQISQGSYILGESFVISGARAEKFLSNSEARNRAIKQYLNGKEFNNIPDCQPVRWIIDFGTRSAEDCAKTFSQIWTYAEQTIREERLSGKNEAAKEKWWQYWRPRIELYRKAQKLPRVIAACRVSKHLALAFLPSNIVYDSALNIFIFPDGLHFGTLQSSIHDAWARRFASTLETRLRYTSADCFDTFPFPEAADRLDDIGETYHEHRRDLMQVMQLGLTKTYNLFHDRALTEGMVEKVSKQVPEVAAQAYQSLLTLRDLHRQMDEEVITAYGWHQDTEDWGPAIALRHDFYEVDYLPENDRIRYTIHSDARKEVLKRLLKLNHERYAEEQAKGVRQEEKNRPPQRLKRPDELL